MGDRGAAMMLSGHQPVYLPGIILFNKIAISDAFMFVPHCQFQNKSWHSRNYIRGDDGPLMLSVPVTHKFGQSIGETKICGNHWREKHLRSIKLHYGKRPFFDDYFPELECMILSPYETIGHLSCSLIYLILDWLGVDTPIYSSNKFGIKGHKTDMLIEMCKALGADSYLSNEGARDYVDETRMRDKGIDHHWQKFTHPVYDQGKPFLPNLSIIDLLFNCGPDAKHIVQGCGHAG